MACQGHWAIAKMLVPMQRQMPPDAMRGLLGIARPHLGPQGWDKLTRALGIPAAEAALA